MVSRRKKIFHWWGRSSLPLRVGVIVAVVVVVVYLAYLQQANRGLYNKQGILLFSILNLNIIVLCGLGFVVGRNVVKLIFDRKKGLLGSGLKLRLVTAFVGLALVPTAILFFLASGLLSQIMEGVFSGQYEARARAAVFVSREHTNLLKHNVRFAAEELKYEILEQPLIYQNVSLLEELFEGVLQRHALSELLLLDAESLAILARVQSKVSKLAQADVLQLGENPIPTRTQIDAVSQDADTKVFIDLEGGSQFVRGYAFFTYRELPVVLICSAPLSAQLVSALKVVHKEFQDQEQLKLFQTPLRSGYLITLGLITLLIIFAAIWIAFYIAKDLSGPIAALLEGTRQIAKGRYSHRIKVAGQDELSMLSRAFNQMSEDLQKTTEDNQARQQFIETIQSQLAVGVIAIDPFFSITSINDAALHLIDKEHHKDVLQKPLTDFFEADVAEKVSSLLHRLQHGKNFVRQGSVLRREQILIMNVQGEERRILCTIGLLQRAGIAQEGYILLFDDVTDLVKAQEVVAWREVARRIAHEIKNPLTPLQLNVQRLERALPENATDSLRNIINTILNHVHSIKRLADEFSRFARMPVVTFDKVDLNTLISELLAEFSDRNKDVVFTFIPEDDLQEVFIDKEQMRRVLYNLLDNALHAFLEDPKSHNSVKLKTVRRNESVVIEVIDNGPGISAEDRDHIFEPYFTKAPGGTGLGLSIVASIVHDHNGHIVLDTGYTDGAKFVIELPLAFQEHTIQEQTKRKITAA